MTTTIPKSNILKITKATIQLIVFVGLTIGAVKGVALYQEHSDIKNYVEPYCEARYKHDVIEYKSCKDLTPTQLLQNITANVGTINGNEIPHLPVINE